MNLDFISKDVREYMERNGLSFTDFEKAALIARTGRHSCLPVLEAMELLQKLAEETEDKVLKSQIQENLTYDREDLDVFWNKAEGFIYTLEIEDKEKGGYVICGNFASAALAYADGKGRRKKFNILKQYLVGYYEMKDGTRPGYTDAMITRNNNHYMHYIAEAEYNEDGILTYFSSCEIERVDRYGLYSAVWKSETERASSPKWYDLGFILVPNPFEIGDIVKIVGHECPGIVNTSQLEWQDFCERVKAAKTEYVDYNEASVVVDFLQDDGSFSRDHVCPAYLERYEPKEEDDARDLLLAAQAVIRGKGGLTRFTACHEKYKERKTETKK